MEWQWLKIRVFSLAKGYFVCEPLQVSKAQLFQKQETTTNNMAKGPLASDGDGRQSQTDSSYDCEKIPIHKAAYFSIFIFKCNSVIIMPPI